MPPTTSFTFPIQKTIRQSTGAPPPALTASRPAVLLIVMPPIRTNHQQRASLTALAESLQHRLSDSVRILRIDEFTHPDIVRSFAVMHTPAFVLVRQGIELWRHEGLIDETTLLELVQRLLAV